MKVVGYKTVNLINGHYYYGVRTLLREGDPYLGSGLRLQDAIKKYGKENFVREDLMEFSTFEEALKWEKETITPEMIISEKCYNLKGGGAGGSLPWTEEKREYHKENGSYKKTEEVKTRMSESAIERFKTEPGTFKGRSHSKESREKMSKLRKGRPGTFKGRKHTEETKEKIRQTKLAARENK